MTTPEVAAANAAVVRARSRVAALGRWQTAKSPELLAAKEDLRQAKLNQRVAVLLADAPPLTELQKVALRDLMRPPRSAAPSRRRRAKRADAA